MAEDDLREEYVQYLERFTAQVGEVEVGSFAKYKGKLIQKMDFDEFRETHSEYHALAAHYLQSMDRGDTINDVIVRSIRDAAAKLVITAPV